jgi:hypothetical protein
MITAKGVHMGDYFEMIVLLTTSVFGVFSGSIAAATRQ